MKDALLALVRFLNANPMFYTVFVWPLLSAVFNAIFGKPTPEEIEKRPRWAAFKRFMSGLGIDPKKALDGLWLILTKQPLFGSVPPPNAPPNASPNASTDDNKPRSP
jgi:hypothetical protein